MDRLFLCLLTGYFIGSFPTAYVLVRSRDGSDIRNSGSGNVGARNTYDVTGSKSLGLIVLFLDLAKGSAATLLPLAFSWGEPLPAIAAGLGAIAGHNYPVWLRFHGGRGLATAAGVMLVLGWIYIVLWCLLWFVIYGGTRNILRGNVGATVLVTPALLLVPESLTRWTSWVPLSYTEFIITSCIVCVLILLRHTGEIRTILKHSNGSSL